VRPRRRGFLLGRFREVPRVPYELPGQANDPIASLAFGNVELGFDSGQALEDRCHAHAIFRYVVIVVVGCGAASKAATTLACFSSTPARSSIFADGNPAAADRSLQGLHRVPDIFDALNLRHVKANDTGLHRGHQKLKDQSSRVEVTFGGSRRYHFGYLFDIF
jgi:hypothetical protein